MPNNTVGYSADQRPIRTPNNMESLDVILPLDIRGCNRLDNGETAGLDSDLSFTGFCIPRRRIFMGVKANWKCGRVTGFISACLFVTHSLNAQAEGKSAETRQDDRNEFQMEEIVVTATKRDSAVRDVPFSVNVQSEEEIQRLNTFNLEDLSRNVPGLSIQNLGPGQSVINIRGVSSGQIVRDQPGVKEQVGIYLDETPVSLSLFTPDIDLFDVSRVETLRGPQGTLFGSGSIGGTVRYITNQPLLNVSEAKAEIDLNTIEQGSQGGHAKAALNAPLGDRAAARLVTYGTRYGGFIDARRGDGQVKEDVNDGGRYGGRFALLLEPTENLSVTPRIVYQDIDLNGFNRDEVFNLFPDSKGAPLRERQQFLLLDEAFEDETLIFDTVVEWRLGDSHDATYAFGHISRDLLVSRDASALAGSVGVDIGLPEEAVWLPSNLRDTTDLEQMTHELRFSSDDGGALQWLVGAFYSNADRDYSQRVPTPGWDSQYRDAGEPIGRLDSARNGFDTTNSPYVSDLAYDLTQMAVFGETTYTPYDRLRLTAGLRWYEWEEDKTFKSGGIFSNSAARNQEVSTESDGFAPRFLVSYDIADPVTVNAQVSRGFRLGGVNDPLNAELCGSANYDTYRVYQEFKDETLWNYELGVKSTFDRIAWSGSVFYSDIENLGVNVDAGPCSSRVTISVPDAHTMGVELELSARPTDSLLLTFAGSYVEAEFDSSIRTQSDVVNADGVVTVPAGAVVAGIRDGNRIPSVPNWQLSASGTYALAGILGAREAYLSASWQFVGERITQPGDQEPGGGRFAHGFDFGDLTTADDATELDLLLHSYHLFNLSAGLTYDQTELVFYVKNLFDEKTKLSFDRERGGRARLAYRVGSPPHYRSYSTDVFLSVSRRLILTPQKSRNINGLARLSASTRRAE